MKLALLLALATVATAIQSFNPSVHSGVFRPGEQYVYHYKGQVLSGIPKTSEQFAGLLIDSLVVLQFQQDYRVVMKMENIKLSKINNKISILPSEPLPESDVTRLTGEQAIVLTESLVKPIKFRYEEGEVRELEKETRDEFWSVNIKKGVLSLFQVTLKEKNQISSDSSLYFDPTMSRIRPFASRPRQTIPYWRQLATPTNSVYKVMESDVTGNCETKYVVISDKTHLSTSSKTMKVNSVRNFDNCVKKPFYIQGIFQGADYHQDEKPLLQPVVQTDYIITGDQTHFLIKQATLRGKYFFLIDGVEGTDMSTHIHQSLTLKETQPIRTPIHLISPKTDVRGLVMLLPKSSLLPERQSYEQMRSGVYGQRVRQQELLDRQIEEQEELTEGQTSPIIPVVEQKLEELVQCIYSQAGQISSGEKKCSERLFEVSQILRQANKQQLKSLLSRYVSVDLSSTSQTQYRKTEILLDLLPTLSSPESGKVLIELIRERHISPVRGAVLTTAMSLVVKPTPTVIRKTLELFKELPRETRITGTSELRKSTMLSVGTMTHRLINVMRSYSKPVPEIISFIDSISQELLRMLEETSELDEKLQILGGISNMGASETIPALKAMAIDQSKPMVLRLAAVSATRRLLPQFNKQIVPVLLDVFMESKNDRTLRGYSCAVLFEFCNPSLSTLQMIAKKLQHERSHQIRSYVYSKLVNMATVSSPLPQHKKLIKNARLVLKTIPPVSVGVYDSMEAQISKYSEKYDVGGVLDLIKFKSSTSGLPEGLSVKLQGTAFGKWKNLFQTGAWGKSVEEILRKTFGPHGLLKEIIRGQVSLEDFLKPLSRPDMGGIEHKIREIINKISAEVRPEGLPFGVLYLTVLQTDLHYVMLHSQNIQDLVSRVSSYIPELMMKLSRGVNVDVVKSLSNVASLTVPSPLGVPLSLNLTTMAIAKVDGRVKVNNMPTWSDLVNRFPTSVPEISVDVDLRPVIDVSHYLKLGADMKWLASCVGVKAQVQSVKPVKLLAKLDTVQHSVSLKYFPHKQPIKMLQAKVVPFTQIQYVPITVNRLPFLWEQKEIKNEQIIKKTPFQFRYRLEPVGHDLEVRGVYSLCGPKWCPIMPLLGRQEVVVIHRPTESVEFIQLKIKSLRSNWQWEGVPASQSTEQFYNELEQEQELNYRTSSHQVLQLEQFEPIPVDRIFQTDPIKRQLLVTLHSSDSQTPQMKTLVTWLMGRTYWKNQINVQTIVRSNQYIPSLKLHLNNVLNPTVWRREQPQMGEIREFLNKLRLAVHINGDIKQIKATISPGSPLDFTQELKQHSLLTTTDNMPLANAQKYKYTLELDLPQMNHKMLKYMTIVHDVVKYQFYSRLTTSIPRNPIQNKIVVAVEVLPWWEQMNIIVKTPRENSYIKSVPLYWNPLLPTNEKIKLHDTSAINFYKQITDDEPIQFIDTVPYTSSPVLAKGECIYSQESEKLKTFDGVRLPLASFEQYRRKSCSVVMAQHCSDSALFSVVASGDSLSTKLRILVPKYEIELIQRGTSYVTVLVNGVEKQLRLAQPLVVLTDQYNEQSPKMYKIEKVASGVVELKAHELGLKVIFNNQDKTTIIKMSPWSMLQGQLCGLCGNYNQDQSDDFNQELDFQPWNRDIFSVYKNSLIPSETCSLETLRQPITSNQCIVQRPLTVRRYDNGVAMTCQSEATVPQCAPGCQPESWRSVKTCFTCAPSPSTSLEEVEQSILPQRSTWSVQSRWESILQDQNSMVQCGDFAQRVEVPTRCIPVY